MLEPYLIQQLLNPRPQDETQVAKRKRISTETRILDLLRSTGEALSTANIAQELDVFLSNVHYSTKILKDKRLIENVGSKSKVIWVYIGNDDE